MSKKWNQDKDAWTPYGENVGGESTGDVEVAQVDGSGKAWGRGEKA